MKTPQKHRLKIFLTRSNLSNFRTRILFKANAVMLPQLTILYTTPVIRYTKCTHSFSDPVMIPLVL